MVFANLECPVTDQHGETQSPKSNVIFCGPPQAAASLKRAHISAVATANNHASDYGTKGIRETIEFLHADSIQFVGTVKDSGGEYAPVILERAGIRIGIVAFTQFLNIRKVGVGMVSLFDSAAARTAIETLKTRVDFVFASYHGGDEYKDVPGENALHQMHLLAEFGTDVVLGHHPHVPEGIEVYQHCLIFHSFGNAVFYQPQLHWTQRSFAALFQFQNRNGRKEITSIELIPFRPGYQPALNLRDDERTELMDRIRSLSSVTITHSERGYFVEYSIAKATP